MKIAVVTADSLSAEQVSAWSRLADSDPTLDNPFFRPEFTLAVAAVRPNVEIAVLSEGDEPVGFFPYQRERRDIARPIGAELCDFQAVILRRGISLDAHQLLRACGLAAWHFNHLLASQPAFQPYHCVYWDSPYMDLRRGYAAYREERLAAGCGTIVQVERKARKLGREIGPLRLVTHATDQSVFELLMDWKARQYQRLRTTNVLASQRTVALLDRIRNLQEPAFAGVLSVLYAGDRLAAIHLGMRSRHVLHVWFPAYDAALAHYSPGLILWLELARAAECLGIRRFDLGKGQERYKSSFQSGATQLAEGSVDLRLAQRTLRRGWLRTREIVRASPLRRPARAVMRYARACLQPREG